MRPYYAKCKKCARTVPNAKKCGICRKTQKVQDFCVAHNRIFPQGAPDCISSIFYERLANVLAQPLSVIFNQSLMQGCIPASWKVAKIIPVYKGKGVKNISGSYRPISLTNVASKIMELVVNSLTLHLESQGYFTSCQHGFCTGKSTVTNKLSCDSIIWQNLNGSKCCNVIFIDFMRAFDKVNHNLVCSKLKAASVDGCYLKWFIDFLSHRWQYVEYGSA